MKEIYQRQKELNITQEEWFTVWMLRRMRKRKRIHRHELQALQYMVKNGGEDIVKQFEDKFKEIRVEGKRMKTSADVHYTDASSDLYSGDPLLDSKYMKKRVKSSVHGTQSKARKRFQRNGSFQKRQSFNRTRSSSQDLQSPRQSRYDNYNYGGSRLDQSKTQVKPSPTELPICIACCCKISNQNKITYKEIK